MISKEEKAFRILMRLGGVANGRQLAKELNITGPNATHEVGQIMRNLVPGRVERLGDGVYRVKASMARSASPMRRKRFNKHCITVGLRSNIK